MKPAAINSPFTDHARNRMHSPAHATRLPPTTRTWSPAPSCTPARPPCVTYRSAARVA
jgi:hypothetical protein